MIQKIFTAIDSISELRPILQLAAEENVTIVFDFNQNRVKFMTLEDGTSSGELIFDTNGNITIYIAAEFYISDFHEVCKILAHELTHLAMTKVYFNNFFPYDAQDKEKETEYRNILEKCKKIDESEGDVFFRKTFSQFTYEVSKLVELITAVPGALIRYEDKLRSLISFKEPLFDFYNQRTLKDIIEAVDRIPLRKEVKQLNNDNGFGWELRASDLIISKLKRSDEYSEFFAKYLQNDHQ